MLLITGGSSDPNLEVLEQKARDIGIPAHFLKVGPEDSPVLSWDLLEDRLTLNRKLVSPQSLFIRYDAITEIADPRPEVVHRAYGWFTTVFGWALAHPSVRLLNRAYEGKITNKPFTLQLALQAGLSIPVTVVSNDLERISETARDHPLIGKPVAGGDYCYPMEEALETVTEQKGIAAIPAIVQNRLVPPEVRLFFVGDEFFAFKVDAETLDYRRSKNWQINCLDLSSLPQEIFVGLQNLNKSLSLDFGAADFKACPQTGKLLFLEVNSQPMFAAFDEACNGKLAQSILNWLSVKSPSN